jgi:hypothetical protein
MKYSFGSRALRWIELRTDVEGSIDLEIPAELKVQSIGAVMTKLFERVRIHDQPGVGVSANPEHNMAAVIDGSIWGDDQRAIQSLTRILKPKTGDDSNLYTDLANYFRRASELWQEMKDMGYTVDLNWTPCCGCWRPQLSLDTEMVDHQAICLSPRMWIHKGAKGKVVSGSFARVGVAASRKIAPGTP